MRISYNITGAERKSLVGAISSELNLGTIVPSTRTEDNIVVR